MEALERSRASQGTLAGGRSSFFSAGNSEEDDFSGFAPDDFGGDDDDEPIDDGMMGAFMTDEDHRFSSISFRESFEAAQPPSQATVLLDAIASGDIVGSQVSHFEYFDKEALEAIQGNNQWAGAAHWKKLQRRRKTKFKDLETSKMDSQQPFTTRKTKKSKTKNKRSSKKDQSNSDGSNQVLVDISNPPHNLDDLLRRPPKPKSKRSSNDPLQLAKAAISKHSKSDNLLPLDAGIEVKQLSSLFSRPASMVGSLIEARSASVVPSSNVKPTKAVGFGDVEEWGGSYGCDYDNDDNDGGGFCFASGDDDDRSDDFVIQDLEGVRKVEKVQVGYATVAKKVDVKRLKRDLWTEIETTFNTATSEFTVEDKERRSTIDSEAEDDKANFAMSFQSTVRDMQDTQSQVDVTLPFYFICVLHLANEKDLELHSQGLEDFSIKYPKI